jgi:fatty acid desaturase
MMNTPVPTGPVDPESLRPMLIEFVRQSSANRPRMFLSRYLPTVFPIGLALWLCAAHPSVWVFALAALVTGFAQNAMGLLMHEGSHNFFHTDRRTNDLIADTLVCLPIFNTVAGYRNEHLDHHRYVSEARDPYASLYSGYSSKVHLAGALLADALLISAVQKFLQRYAVKPATNEERPGSGAALALIGTQVALFVLYTLVTGTWYAYFVVWLLPLMTMTQFINRVRTMAEHAPDAGEDAAARGTVPTLLEYLLIAPYGYSHHYEHHLAPTIPYYQLASAHRLLEQHGVRFARNQITGGYLRAFWRVAGTIGPAR